VIDEPDAKELVVSNSEVEFGTHPTPFHHKHMLPFDKSGAGKSTILHVPYDLQPSLGHIIIDSQNVCTVMLSSIRRTIGIVLKDPIRFKPSIEYNIAYDQPSATPPLMKRPSSQAPKLLRCMTISWVSQRGMR
jgi:ABC-type sulfate/molybdate transport systems ATPase subunit